MRWAFSWTGYRIPSLGWRVARLPDMIRSLTRMGWRRAGNPLLGLPPRRPLPAWNAMFRRDLLPMVEREKRILEAFDHHLASRLNEERLIGQIAFEYGTLLNWNPPWSTLSVLDIGTGSSTLPRWMVSRGASVVCFEFPQAVEVKPVRGTLTKIADVVLRRLPHSVRWVFGSMLELPFADGTFDLVTSFSVIEHLDTDLTDRSYVPYKEQKKRAARVLREMIRVTKPGGHVFITSDCCDYLKAEADAWRVHYYFKDGPELSGAWPVRDVQEIFYNYLNEHGCTLVGPNSFSAADLVGDGKFATFRGPFFSAFAVLATKNPRQSGGASWHGP